MKVRILMVALAMAASLPLRATTFIVPTDDEMVDKADAIIMGEVGASSVEADGDEVFTVYEIKVLQKLKGGVQRDDVLRVFAFGGSTPSGGVIVNGAARYENGEVALIFLSRDKDRRWRTTEMQLGKFRRDLRNGTERVLVRDFDDSAVLDRGGNVHRENPRREREFLNYIAARVRGERTNANYFTSSFPIASDSAALTLETEPNALFPPGTYTSNIATCTGCADHRPTRWNDAAMSAGVRFHKRSGYNITGAADGGAGAIQSGLAAWTNDCGSSVKLVYAGETAAASQNFDTTHVVEFNDPQGRVPGSWSGSGTIAITFNSFGSTHTFQGATWWTITDADVVFQDGFPATNAAFATAMTHELGHGIGWRHSNQHFTDNAACNPAVEECTSAAIMNSSAVSAYGYTLQPWDVNAVRSVYPGGTCDSTPPPPTCVAPTIASQPASTSITSGAQATLSVSASGTGPLSYQWYSGTSGNLSAPISGATGATLTVTPTANASYWVRVSNACGSVNSATATVSVTAASPAVATSLYIVPQCRALDTRNSTAIPGNGSRTLTIAGACSVPASARSVALNVTAVGSSATGWLTLYPSDASRPTASTVNFPAGKIRANNATIRLSSSGSLTIFNASPNPIHVLVDVFGFFQ